MIIRYLSLIGAIWLSVARLTAALPDVVKSLSIPDTLKNKFINAASSDKKVDALNEISFYLINSDAELAVEFSRNALRLADSLNYVNGLFEANTNIGIAFYRTSRFKQALTCLSSAEEIAKVIGSKSLLASVYSNMALVYNSLADYEKSLTYNFKALEIRTSVDDTMAIAISLNNLGMTYHLKSDFIQARDYYGKAYEIKFKQHDKDGMASTLNNVGQLFFEMYSDSTTWALDSALKYYLKAYYQWNNTGNKVGLSQVLPNIGNVYSTQGINDKAIDAYRAALNIQKQCKDSAGIALTLYNIGISCYNKSEYKEAKINFDQSVEIARKFNISDLLKDNLKMLFRIAGDSKDYKQAFDFANNYMQLNDSLNELNHQQLINEFNGKYEYQMIENMRLQKSIVHSRMWFYILGGISLLMLIIFIFTVVKKKNGELNN
jgi:tetratricopeptide (TPR) repeat protein